MINFSLFLYINQEKVKFFLLYLLNKANLIFHAYYLYNDTKKKKTI